MRQRSYIIKGRLNAQFEALALLEASKWFTVTPLPEEKYEFTVKDE